MIGKRTSLVGVLDGSAVTLYVNGFVDKTGTLTTAPAYAASALLDAAGYTGVSRNSNCRLLIGTVSNAAWNQSDAELFHAQPYAMFAAPVWRRWFVPAAAVVPPAVVTDTGDIWRRCYGYF